MDTSESDGEATSPNFNVFVNNAVSELLNIPIDEGTKEIALFISGRNGSIPRAHPKQLKNELTQYMEDKSDITSVRFTRLGRLLVVTRSVSTAQKILKIQSLLGVPVEPAIITETISTRFLLHNILPSVSCQEIASELQEQGINILEVRRFLRKSENGDIPTTTVLVTKLGTKLPTSVSLWYQYHRVTLFWDNPRPCTNCYKFNHSSKGCRSERICEKCGESHLNECTATSPKCSNCKGQHPVSDKNCPVYLQEKQIQKYRSLHHLTISEARRQFKDNAKPTDNLGSRSYAEAAASSPSPSQAVPISQTLQAEFQSLSQSLTSIFSDFAAQMLAIQQTNTILLQKLSDSYQQLIAIVNGEDQDTVPPTNSQTRPLPQSDEEDDDAAVSLVKRQKMELAEKLQQFADGLGRITLPQMSFFTPADPPPPGRTASK